MVELFRRTVAIMFAGVMGFAGAASAQPAASGDPPGRVGRLAFVQGTVSFHERERTDWAPAVVNRPLTSGDALWTEPNARSEISISGSRVRLDSRTQLDMLVIDDRQTRMQLGQGRLDIKAITFDTQQPYEVLTPRGTITLQQQGDYYVEAGSTQDPTRLGVRAGLAQIQAANGQVLAVRAGEVGEVFDDNGSPQLRTIRSAPPPMPTYWAERDRVVVYDQAPQYLSAGVTGYEDLNAYGSWRNDPEYGQVWAPRAIVAGWEPYRTGQWSYVQPWGWTWVDEQPWGFAPYHYGRWAQRSDRWFWVPPERDVRPVYAPALVAFVGGLELGMAIGQQSRAPVGWFPLGPREVYLPPYSSDRDYYRRLNASARVQEQVMEDRWQRAERREAIAENQQQAAFMNRRFATVVSADDFAHSRPVARVALKVSPDRIAAAPVALVAAPPSPTQSMRAVQAPGGAAGTSANRPNEPNARASGQAQGQAAANVPTTETRLSNMQAIGRPQPAAGDRPRAPGPQIATTRPNEPTAPTAAPGATTPNAAATATSPTGAPNATHPGLPPLAPRTGAAPPQLQGERTPAPGQPGQPAQPGTAPKPADNRAVTTPPPTGAQSPANQPGQPRPPGQANLPPVQPPNANRPVEPPKPGQPSAVPPAQQHQATPATPATPPTQPQHQATPATPATPPTQHPVGPPKPQQAQQPATPAQPAPQPPHQAEPPKPQGAVTPPPQPQRQAAPQPQASPPPAQAHAPAPQPQAAPPPQAHAPAPPPPQAAHPAPAPQPPQQAQQQQQQQQRPAPAAAPQKKDEEKK